MNQQRTIAKSATSGFPVNTLLALLAVGAALAACGGGTVGAADGVSRAPDGAATADAPTVDGGSWPRTATVSLNDGGLRLVDGVVGHGGDLRLGYGRLIEFETPNAESLCAMGVYPSLADVPTTSDACRFGSQWSTFWGVLPYSAGATNQAVGAAFLVRDANHRATYRLRVVSDSAALGAATVTVEYSPTP